MTPVILQSARFHVPPQFLYEMYMDSEKHSAATAAPAKMSRKIGGKWQAHGGQIGGKNLMLVPGKMIVQAWRAAHWKKEHVSILVLAFDKTPGGARVDLVHANVPGYDHRGVREGWKKYYWERWRKYISTQKKKAKKR